MIRFVLRFVGLWLLAAGFIFVVYDGTKSIAGNGLFLTRVQDVWSNVNQASLTALKPMLDHRADLQKSIDAGLIEWSAECAGRRRIGRRTIDLFETIFSVGDFIVGAEQTDAITAARGRRGIAAANTEMADRHGSEHLLHQAIEIAAAHNRRQVSGKFVFERYQVLTVIVRIVEPVAHDAH